MLSKNETFCVQLEQLQKWTSAKWIALLEKNEGIWAFFAYTEWGGALSENVEMFMKKNHKWLDSTIDANRVRYKGLKKEIGNLQSEKIYSFAIPNEDKLLILGADSLSKQERLLFKQSANIFSSSIALADENEKLVEDLKKQGEAHAMVEDRLVQAAKLAAVGEMAAGVAHELNNPLTTVSGFAELILESMDPAIPEYEDMTLILKEARRARSVVRRLLDFSRQDEILRTDADVNEVVSTVLALVHHLAEINNVKISVALWDEIPLIRLEKNQIQQVLLNLIHNAIQAMPGGGELDIETQVNNKDSDKWVTIIIKDNGIGIGEEDLEKIFRPFFTTKITGEGTGLGLSISYRIVVDHGGYIDVDSKPGEGTSFAVWLPVDNSATEMVEK